MNKKFISTDVILEYLDSLITKGTTNVNVGEIARFVINHSTGTVKATNYANWIHGAYFDYCSSCSALGNEHDEHCHHCGAQMLNYKPKWLKVRT